MPAAGGSMQGRREGGLRGAWHPNKLLIYLIFISS
jgi:hypothetical protein